MMEVLQATNTLLALLNTGLSVLSQATQVSALIQKAQSEGRTTLSPEEMSLITNADDASRKALVDAISKALLAK